MNKNLKNVPQDLIVYALRYSIGRMSYAPHDWIDFARKNWFEFSKNIKAAIKREIRDAIKDNRLGDEKIDKPAWLNFYEYIKDL